MFDPKFLTCLQQIDAPLTKIGADSNVFCVMTCITKSCPNRNDAISGIDRITMQNGFKGNQNFGCLLDIEDSDVVPLLKWRDVLNGGREGLQVSECFKKHIINVKIRCLLLQMIINFNNLFISGLVVNTHVSCSN